MQSKAGRLTMVGILVAAAIALFVVLKSDDTGDSTSAGTTTTTATTPTTAAGSGDGAYSKGDAAGGAAPVAAAQTIRFAGGAVVGGEQKLTFTSGDQIRFNVAIDDPSTVEEIHFHGYEVVRNRPGKLTKFDVPAGLEGVYEVEIHLVNGDELPLASISVQPS